MYKLKLTNNNLKLLLKNVLNYQNLLKSQYLTFNIINHKN